jgi:hypothetical protein
MASSNGVARGPDAGSEREGGKLRVNALSVPPCVRHVVVPALLSVQCCGRLREPPGQAVAPV